ncbi:DUF2975 domain-containing protein [uncultured Lacinutrix sp.]|uniref:DUF2975 domain-containing protein n=1 Tax=uncultured Lacinutrix sp. TaxID=574032 RepID=UPI0026196F78|nr:DUF2975 domain-containing protein [uncultured Lacinutrix sp.]
MKTIKLLKKLIDVFFVLLLLSLFIYIVVGILYFGFSDLLPEGAIEVQDFIVKDKAMSIFFTILAIAFGFFVKGVFHLRKTIPLLLTGDYFSETITKHFRACGIIFIYVGLTALLVHLISQWYLNSIIWIRIDTQIYMFLFLIIIGLFFKLFSIVFSKARDLKQENELTI